MTFFSSFCELSTHDICHMEQCVCPCHRNADTDGSIFMLNDEDALARISYHFWKQGLHAQSETEIGRVVDARWPFLAFRREFIAIIRETTSHQDWSLSRLHQELTRYFPGH